MQRLDLNQTELALYHEALAAPVRNHRTRLLITDNDHEVERDVVLMALDGQVTVAANGENGSTRSLSLTVADPSNSLGLDPFSVGEYPIYPQKMIQVRAGLYVPALGWVDCSVHTGPLTKCLPADEMTVEIEAVGKEVLASSAIQQRAWGPKTPKTDIVRALLRSTGERESRIEVPDLPKRKTSKRFVLLDTDNPWRKACQIADSMGYELYYDGRGVAVMRRRPKDAVAFEFGPAMVLGDLETEATTGPIFNTFVVTGGKPKGSKKRVTSGRPRIELNEDHEWSAKNLGRNGVPRRLTQRVENSQLTRAVDCRYKAFQLRDAAVSISTEIAAEVIPAFHLDLFDRVRVDAANAERVLALREFTIPLAGQSQGLGTTRRTGDAWMPKKPKPPKKRKSKGKGKGGKGKGGKGRKNRRKDRK